MEEKKIEFYSGPERRKQWHTPDDCIKVTAVQECIERINYRLDDGDARMARIEKNQEEAKEQRVLLSAKLDMNISNVDELLDIMRAGKGFFKVVGLIGNTIKWCAAVAAPIIGLWFAFKEAAK